MAITRVTITARADFSGTPTTTYASTATSATTGNALIVAVGGNATGGQSVTGVADTAGNPYVKAQHLAGLDAYREEMWYAKNITGHATNVVTVTWSGAVGYVGIVVVQYAGVHLTAPFDAAATGTAAAGNASVTTGTLTTTVSDEVHVLVPRWGLTDTLTWPSGFSGNISPNLLAQLAERFPGGGAPVVGTYTITHPSGAVAKLALAAAFMPPAAAAHAETFTILPV